MCGLVGFLGFQSEYSLDAQSILKKMADTLISRGPDDSGYWCDMDQHIGFGHRRLSIIDSSSGSQPMHSVSGRYVIAFNGEIYNHLKLREELKRAQSAPAWRGRSDTETLLAVVEAFGIQAALERAIGMFAFAIWDRKNHLLTLARDRLGEKPLYYGWQNQGDRAVFLFGSELKALKAHPKFTKVINRDALCLFLRHNYIPAPYSIYEGIAKLAPGCLLEVSLQQRDPKILPYWCGKQMVQSALADPFTGHASAAVDQLEALLKDAIYQQMQADVPLGAFLSGGIDSSTIVALMQAQSSRPIKTFSIGFHEALYNEAQHAKTVAQHLGTAHTELYVTAQDAMNIIPNLPRLYCEPFADSSQIPTFLLAQLAKQDVTVSLSGDGGDELFCGYTRYQMTAQLWNKLAYIPQPMRAVIGKAIQQVSPNLLNSMASVLAKIVPQMKRFSNLGHKILRGGEVLDSKSVDELYFRLISHGSPTENLVLHHQSDPPKLMKALQQNGLDDVQSMMLVDLLTYLPDDILVKVDRAAMGVSLETRIPFLDHRVVEFAWQLPQTMKLHRGQTKWILRQILQKYMPTSFIERPKNGFSVFPFPTGCASHYETGADRFDS